MTPKEIRQRLVAALLDAGEPLTPDELAECCGVPKARLRRQSCTCPRLLPRRLRKLDAKNRTRRTIWWRYCTKAKPEERKRESAAGERTGWNNHFHRCWRIGPCA